MDINDGLEVVDLPLPAFKRTSALLQRGHRLPYHDKATDAGSDRDETGTAELLLGNEREEDVDDRDQQTRRQAELLYLRQFRSESDHERVLQPVPWTIAICPLGRGPAIAER